MNPVVRYVGGATLASALVFAAAVVAGRALEQDGEARANPFPAAIGAGPQMQEAGDSPAGALDALPASPAAATVAAPEDPFIIKRILPIEGPIRYGQWFWDEEGVPDGPLVMTVDLKARVLSVFRGGYEIGAAAVLLGTQEYPTPTGVFPILSKERHNVSEKYNNAPMPWTLRLTWDGVAIHGGSQVENGYASHGCIAAPDAFVSRLFAIARKGDRVIITDGKTTGIGQSLISG